MNKFGAFFLAFKLFSGLNPSWVYVDNGKIHYLFEKRGNRLVQGGITIKSYELPYCDSVVVSVEGREHTYRGEISVYVTRAGKLMIINRIKLEDAVKSVLATIPINNKNGELLKLKSIIARTILLYLSRTKRLIPDSTEFFIYKGRDSEYPLGNFASKFTIGEFLTMNDSLIIPFYHINSGGITEDGEEIGCNFPYLVNIIDTFAKFGEHFSWQVNTTQDSLLSLLSSRTIEPLDFTQTGRVLSFSLDSERVVNADTVRRLLNLPSLLLYIEKEKDTIKIYGSGKGSGLGISLESADYMTRNGLSYVDVINLFYGRKVEITRRLTYEELYRTPLVQYAQEEGTCPHYR